MKTITLLLSLIAALSSILLNPNAARAEGQIKIWIATASRDLFKKIQPPFERETGIKILEAGDTKLISSNIYLRDVSEKKVDAATSSLPYEDWAAAARKDGITPAPDMTHRVIGHDILKILVNPEAGVSELSLEQIQSIFTGKNKNWSELGGKNIPITLVYAPVKTATNSAFSKLALKGQELGGTLVTRESFEAIVTEIEKSAGAVGFMNSAIDVGKTRVVKTPVIGRPITLITRGKPSPEVLKLIQFIREKGREHGVK